MVQLSAVRDKFILTNVDRPALGCIHAPIKCVLSRPSVMANHSEHEA